MLLYEKGVGSSAQNYLHAFPVCEMYVLAKALVNVAASYVHFH